MQLQHLRQLLQPDAKSSGCSERKVSIEAFVDEVGATSAEGCSATQYSLLGSRPEPLEIPPQDFGIAAHGG